MRFFSVLAVTVILAGCATVDLHKEVARVDIKCSSYSFQTATDSANCFDHKERPLFADNAPEILSDYGAFSDKRARLASDFDAKKITLDDYKYQISLAVAQLQGAWKNYDIIQTSEKQASDQANAESNAEFARDLLLAVGSVAYARASADQARSQALQQSMPKMQTTTCRPGYGEVQCTTYGY